MARCNKSLLIWQLTSLTPIQPILGLRLFPRVKEKEESECVVKGETEEDVMKNWKEHVKKAHGMKEEDMTPDMKQKEDLSAVLNFFN